MHKELCYSASKSRHKSRELQFTYARRPHWQFSLFFQTFKIFFGKLLNFNHKATKGFNSYSNFNLFICK